MKIIKKVTACILITAMVLVNFSIIKTNKVQADTGNIISSDFLKANGKELKNNYGNGATIYLRGTNAAGYMLQELWMCPTSYTTNVDCQMDILNTLNSRFGSTATRTLIDTYESNYWKESDFDKCASLGMNCIRLPLWYRNFVDENGNWYSNAFDRVDWFVEQAGKRGMYVIIDMHGAYGSQNGSDHSGVDGGSDKQGASQFFFGSNASSNQEKYYQMWEKIATHYKGNPTVAGYDLLNEPYNEYRYKSSYSDDYLHELLWGIYDNAYDRIRAIDSDHVIIMEATWESWDLPNPSNYGWDNVMYEYHCYNYGDYDNASNQQITTMQNKINNIFSAGYNVPSYMGEFSFFNNTSAWATGLQLLNDNGLNWTSWSYKCVSEYGNWGLMNQSISSVNVESDSYDTILSKWSNVGSSYENTNLINVFKNYTPGVIPYKNISAPDEGKYYLNCNGKIICAEDEGNSPLIANRDSYSGAWETLYVINNGDGTISLKSDINGKYVCAVVDEQCQLLARSSSISTWEKFYPIKIQNNQYGLLAVANGKYVKADFDDTTNNGQLKAVSDSIGGAWEAFDFNAVTAEETTTKAPETTQVPTTVAATTKAQATTTVAPTTTKAQTTTEASTTKSTGQPIEVIGLVIQKTEGNKVTFAWGQSQEQINIGQKYNVYIDGTLYQTYDGAQTVEYSFKSSGEHSITVKAVLGGVESQGSTVKATIEQGETTAALTTQETTKEPTTVPQTTEEQTTKTQSGIVISDDIKVEGFQISNVLGGLRTVSSVEPQINGQSVTEYGNIYAIDRGNVTSNDMYVGSTNQYVAYYKATSQGIIDINLSDSTTAVNYVRTITNNGNTSEACQQKYIVRAYAKLSDGSYVYSKAYTYSIFNVAKYLYNNVMMSTSAGHDYLYNNILKVVDGTYSEVDYNWNNTVVKP